MRTMTSRTPLFLLLAVTVPLAAKDKSKCPTTQAIAPTHAGVAYGDDPRQMALT